MSNLDLYFPITPHWSYNWATVTNQASWQIYTPPAAVPFGHIVTADDGTTSNVCARSTGGKVTTRLAYSCVPFILHNNTGYTVLRWGLRVVLDPSTYGLTTDPKYNANYEPSSANISSYEDACFGMTIFGYGEGLPGNTIWSLVTPGFSTMYAFWVSTYRFDSHNNLMHLSPTNLARGLNWYNSATYKASTVTVPGYSPSRSYIERRWCTAGNTLPAFIGKDGVGTPANQDYITLNAGGFLWGALFFYCCDNGGVLDGGNYTPPNALFHRHGYWIEDDLVNDGLAVSVAPYWGGNINVRISNIGIFTGGKTYYA